MTTPNLTINGGAFQTFEGQPVANGNLLLSLSHDEQYSIGPSQIVSGLKIKIPLDSSGNINPSVLVYSNDTLLPSGSFYTVYCYEADGTLVWGPQYWSLTALPNPLNVANVVPTFPPNSGLSGGGGATLLLETNGTPNGSQTKLNLHSSDSSVTLTDDGSGDVNFQVVSSPSSGVGNLHYWSVSPTNAASISALNTSPNVGFSLFSNAASGSYVAPTATDTGYAQFSQTESVNSTVYVVDGQTLNDAVTLGSFKSFYTRTFQSAITSRVVWIGLAPFSEDLTTPTPTGMVAMFRFNSATDTNWLAWCQTDNSHVTSVDTGVVVDTTGHVFTITKSGSSLVFNIDGTNVSAISTNLPSNSTRMTPTNQLTVGVAGSYNVNVAYMGWTGI